MAGTGEDMLADSSAEFSEGLTVRPVTTGVDDFKLCFTSTGLFYFVIYTCRELKFSPKLRVMRLNKVVLVTGSWTGSDEASTKIRALYDTGGFNFVGSNNYVYLSSDHNNEKRERIIVTTVACFQGDVSLMSLLLLFQSFPR